MHEVSIAEEIKDIVIRKLKENNGKKVKKIKLLIGEMTSVVPEALKFAFDVVAKGTPLENARLHIKKARVMAKCKVCFKEFRIKEYIFVCPGCNSTDIEIKCGREMVIQTIEMEQ